jgi:Ribonuclease D
MQDSFECARYADLPRPFPDIAAGKSHRLSKEDINALPLFHYSGEITLVRSGEELDYALTRLVRKDGALAPILGNGTRQTVLGFDTETLPSFRKGSSHSPSLIQMALEDEVFLFHVKWIPFDRNIIDILEAPDIIKTGVAVHDDMAFLSKIAAFVPSSVVDLGNVAKRNNVENHGLRGLAAAFLGLRISKGEQCSNWGNGNLTPRQIRYAATDAWISRAVYLRMLEAGLDVSPEPAILQPKSNRRGHKAIVIRKRPQPRT